MRKWHQYTGIFRERACAAAILKCSGRKIQQLFLSWCGVAPSRQVIESWLCADIPELVYSGYYCYDEQVVRVKGKKAFRLTLFDAVLNVPVAEEVSYRLNAKRVKAFLKKNVRGHPVYSITTDDKMVQGNNERFEGYPPVVWISLHKTCDRRYSMVFRATITR